MQSAIKSNVGLSETSTAQQGLLGKDSLSLSIGAFTEGSLSMRGSNKDGKAIRESEKERERTWKAVRMYWVRTVGPSCLDSIALPHTDNGSQSREDGPYRHKWSAIKRGCLTTWPCGEGQLLGLRGPAQWTKHAPFKEFKSKAESSQRPAQWMNHDPLFLIKHSG